jgi:hypothetical protein
MAKNKERVFLDLKEKEAQSSGIFVRNDLIKIIQQIEAEGQQKVIGIVYNDTWNLEILTKDLHE